MPDTEARAALADAHAALASALMWLDGEYVDKPRTEFNRGAWARTARRGLAALVGTVCHECGRTLPVAMTVHVSPVTWDACLGGADRQAALAPPPPDDERLDVERLAKAINEVTRADPSESTLDWNLDFGREWYGSPREFATDIASEYAALSPDEPGETHDPPEKPG